MPNHSIAVSSTHSGTISPSLQPFHRPTYPLFTSRDIPFPHFCIIPPSAKRCRPMGGARNFYLGYNNPREPGWSRDTAPHHLDKVNGSARLSQVLFVTIDCLLWSPYGIGQAIIFSSGGFLWPPCVADADIIFYPVFSFYIFYFSPNLSGRTFDVYHTSTHDVALARIYNACLKCAACDSLEIQDAKNRNMRAIAQFCRAFYIFVTKACDDNPKKNLLNSNISSTCLYNMVNFGPLTAEICWRVWAPQQISTGFASWQPYCTAL